MLQSQPGETGSRQSFPKESGMTTAPLEITVGLSPRARYDAIDVSERVRREHGALLADFPRILYCSHHTTAGYLDQAFARRLLDRGRGIDPFVEAFQTLFPEQAGYQHDELDRRIELTEEERRREPPNADAHLTFIGSGLSSCATYLNDDASPVFFVDLDGEYQGRVRDRTTSLIAYHEEEPVEVFELEVPVSHHTIDSVNLNDRRLGLRQRIDDLVAGLGGAGRVDIALAPSERSAAVTVNEYETLLMRHDLAEVVRDPLRFVARQGKRMLQDPRAVPAKSIGYAKYDAVQILNRMMDALGLSESLFERLVSRAMALPASRMLRWRRSISVPVSARPDGQPQLLHGRFQSPILIQWEPSEARSRRLQISIHRFR